MIENVEEIWIVAGVILGALGTASGWIKDHYSQIKLVAEKALNRDLNGTVAGIIDLMSSDVPQTEEQTALIETGIVPEKTWKMSDDAKEQLFRDLRNWGAEIRKSDLIAVIEKAESENQVEYGIVIYDHQGKIDQSIINEGNPDPSQVHEVYHGFVTYGAGKVQPYKQTENMIKDTHSKAYPLEIFWYMTDFEKETLMSNIGYNNPKCIEEARRVIKQAEDEQWETYSVGCGERGWEIVRGNVVSSWANPKTDEPIVTKTSTAEVAATT